MPRIDVPSMVLVGAFVLGSPILNGSGGASPRGQESQATQEQARPSPADVPEGLAASDWSAIRAAYEAGRHTACAVEGGYLARNPGQQWETFFDDRGSSVRPDAGGWGWGLELERYGFPGDERAVTEPVDWNATGQRVTYRWDRLLEEWYVNDTRGLEHGFTLHERPAKSAPGEPTPLTFTLKVHGELRAALQGDARGARFCNADGVTVLTYAGLQVLDAEGQRLHAQLELVPDGLRLSIDEHRARYPLTIDPIAQQAFLKSPSGAQYEYFGGSVSISGDTVVVGATGSGFGAAYVFVRSGTSWSQQARIAASNTGFINDGFGATVSISGDTIVVGAPYEDSAATGVNGDPSDNSAPDAGAAYVFVRSGTNWSQQAYLKASNTGAGDGFGSGGVSGDTVVVGANLEDSNATGVNGDQSNNGSLNSGAAYVFVRNGTTWSPQAYLKASNTEGGDFFGYVSLSGDTVVVGASREDSNAIGVNGDQSNNDALDSGAAYVFVRDGASWSQQAYLKASNTGGTLTPGDGDAFGVTAISGDLVIVGAPLEDSTATGVNGDGNDNGASNSGAAYLFVRNGESWSQAAYLKASNTSPGDFFGGALSVSGGTAIVGAPLENSTITGQGHGLTDSGAAYIFQLSQSSVAFRNAGANPASYVASPIVMGSTFTAAVDNNLASQLTSILVAFDTPFLFRLGGGQSLLCLDLGGSGEVFTGAGLFPSSSAGGVDSFAIPVGDDPATCGVVLYSQAIQFGNPPFMLSNAQDLTIGSF